jgi:peptide/nickel transport system substrate-binding protein
MALVTLAGQPVDPHVTRVNNLAPITTSCFEQFFRWSPDGQLVPALASKMEEPPDHMKLVFTLRAGTTFWDGSAVTAADAKWSFERYATVTPGDTYQGKMRELVDSVTTPDARTVVVNMKAPNTSRLSFSGIHPRGWNIASQAYYQKVGEDRFRTAPMCTGPFRIAQNDPPQSMRLEAYAGHYERAPHVQSVTMNVVPDLSVRVDHLMSGNAGFIDGVAGDARKQVQETKGYRLYESEAAALTTLFFQQPDKVPYRDLRVRQALQYATDQDSLIAYVLDGAGRRSPAAHIFPVTAGYTADRFPAQPFDVKRARELLAAAGFGGGVEVTAWGYDSSSAPMIPTMLQALAGMWREAGVTLKLNLLEATSYLGRYGDHTLTDLTALASGAWFDGESLLATDYQTGQPFAPPMSDDITQRIRAIGQQFDEPARLRAIQDVYGLIIDGAWSVTLPWATAAWGARQDRVADWRPYKAWAYPHAFDTLVAAGA